MNFTMNSIESKASCYELTTFEAFLIVDTEQNDLPNFINFSQTQKDCTLAIDTDLASSVGKYELWVVESSDQFNATSTVHLDLKV